jgi:large subunit ribosomal protein L4
MKLDIKTLDNKSAGSIDLDDSVFGLPPRADILQRMVRYQLARRRQGTHKVKERNEVAMSGRKIYRQKGTGNARHGAASANIFVGGGVAHGPRPRDHAHRLPKKVRKLAMKTALSAKQAEGKLVVIDDLKLDAPKTRALARQLEALGISSALIVGGESVDVNFALAVNNLAGIDVLPQQGANVYDILRRDTLVLTRDAVKHLEERLK